MRAGLFAWAFIALTFLAVVSGVVSSVFNEWQRSTLGPLHVAAWDGNVAECERLVKSGIPVDATDADGVPPLSWAVYYCRVEVVRKLIELGADVNHVDRLGGFTPLMYTATRLRGKKLRGTQAQRNEIAHVLIQHGADVNHAMDGGQVTLHFAAADKNAGLVRMLLAAGANGNVRSTLGYTPLDVAKFPDYAPNDEVIAALQQSAQ